MLDIKEILDDDCFRMLISMERVLYCIIGFAFILLRSVDVITRVYTDVYPILLGLIIFYACLISVDTYVIELIRSGTRELDRIVVVYNNYPTMPPPDYNSVVPEALRGIVTSGIDDRWDDDDLPSYENVKARREGSRQPPRYVFVEDTS